MEKFPLTFSRRNFAFLGICLGGLVLLLLISVLPLIAQKKDLTEQIPAMKAKIAQQAQLVTVLHAIDQKLQALAKIDNLPSVALSSLPIIESSSVLDRIASLALEQKLTLIAINPIIPKSSKDLRLLTFESSVQGSLTNIRSFIYSLLQVPYIDTIDKLQIRSNDNKLDLNLVFSVRLT